MSRFLGLFIGILLLGVGGFLYTDLFWEGEVEVVEVPVFVEQAPRFFQDELVLADGKDLYAFSFNRKEEAEGFRHYYSSVINGDRRWDSFYEEVYEVSEGELVRSFENELFEDLSTREWYKMELNVEGEVMKIEIEDFEGDFITKNRPEYTRYHSIGKARVEYGGEVREMDVFLEKLYSSDYRKWLFFEGIDTIGSRTYKFELWDEEGNFYLMDDTEVIGEHPAYQPHSWFVSKSADGSLRKAFEMEVEESYPNWEVQVGDLEFVLEADSVEPGNWVEGKIEGSVNGRSLYGRYSFKKS